MSAPGPARHAPRPGADRGFTLVEVIVFIVVMSVGVFGLVSVMGPTLRRSPDPMLRKQQMAVAESLLSEVLNQPFTFCDPNDANFSTATSLASCTGGAANSEDKGGAPLTSPTPSAKTRYGSGIDQVFDNVADYGGASSTGGGLHNPIDDITGNFAVPGYTASIAVNRTGTAFGASNDAALAVTVTVSHAGLDDYSLTGYRFRYAPRN
ncbi:MAG: prepilin-type N-terminal cleavage/methylation domain-containing protein [Paucibacter sp.]|nr:prepilin-type N-terminal cleavage/methylation domain-containing protein [Roseateles sp.]